MRTKLTLLCVTAATAVALLAPMSSQGAVCPPGQTGTPPYCVTPTIVIKKVKATPAAITITVKVNAAGRVKVSGKGIKTTTVSVQPGSTTLMANLTTQEKKLLDQKGKVRIQVTIAYTPTGGSTIVKTVTVTIKKSKR